MLFADRRATKQILLNLLANAVKFTGEKGEVRVRARTSEGAAIVSISDTGERLSCRYDVSNPNSASGFSIFICGYSAYVRALSGRLKPASRDGSFASGDSSTCPRPVRPELISATHCSSSLLRPMSQNTSTAS